MALSDLFKGKGGDGKLPPPPPMSVEIKAEPLDAKSATRKFVEALGEALGIKTPPREMDVERVLEAFKLLDVATEDETGEGPDEKEKPEEGGDENEESDEAAE